MLLRCTTLIREFCNDERGATAIEYALIAGGIASVVAGTVSQLGDNVTSMWTNVQVALN